MRTGLSKLEVSLAIMRLIPKFEILKSQSAEYYLERILRLYHLAFIDSHRFDLKAPNAEELQPLLKELLYNLELYHSTGAIKLSIEKFYKQFLTLEPFTMGNELILKKFLIEVANSYEIDLDFRREDAFDSKNQIIDNYQGEEWPQIQSAIKIKDGKNYLNLTDIDFPIDTDFLTGLDIEAELNDFYQEIHNRGIGMMDADPDDESYTQKTRTALTRVQSFREFINECVSKVIRDKKPMSGIGKPKFFMTQGGIGSGKTKLEKYAANLTDNNYIIASVDEARAMIPEYQLYIKAGHHSDDYKALRTFSYVIMGEIIDKAISENYNYCRDGSGIPYKSRNHELIKIMKDSGYETYILSAAAPLYIPHDRKDLTDPVHERIIERFKKKQRAVPWSIVLKNHISHPLAMMQAVGDEDNDHVVIFDNMSARGSGYKIAQTYWVEEKFVTNENPMNLAESLGFFEDIKTTVEAKLHYLIVAKRRKYDHRLFMYRDVYKILVIYNQDRFADIIDKSKFNINARGYEDLPFNTLRFMSPAQ